MNYYDILGVDRSADQEQIKRAYKTLVKQHHPDQGGDAEHFKQINEAYETLKDPDRKQQYDNPQTQFGFDSTSFSGHPFEDIFANLFRQQRRQLKNKDIRIQVNVDLVDCLTGKSLIVSYRLGNGEQADVTIEIPKGISTGDSIRYQGLGDNTVKELPRGDLHTVVNVQPSRDFVRNYNDLTTVKSVNVLDLLTGCAIIVNTLEGKQMSLNIPQGTNPETTFSMKGYGIPDINTGIRGNLYVKIKAFVPKIENNTTILEISKIKKQIETEE
jgi:DnaJ-class molecular chaperone